MPVDKNALIKKIGVNKNLQQLRDLATVLGVSNALGQNVPTTQKRLIEAVEKMDQDELDKKIKTRPAVSPTSSPAVQEIDYAKLALEMFRLQEAQRAAPTQSQPTPPPLAQTEPEEIVIEVEKEADEKKPVEEVVEDTQPVTPVELEEDPENEALRIWKRYWRWIVAAILAILATLALLGVIITTILQAFGWTLVLFCLFVPFAAGSLIALFWPKKKEEKK